MATVTQLRGPQLPRVGGGGGGGGVGDDDGDDEPDDVRPRAAAAAAAAATTSVGTPGVGGVGVGGGGGHTGGGGGGGAGGGRRSGSSGVWDARGGVYGSGNINTARSDGARSDGGRSDGGAGGGGARSARSDGGRSARSVHSDGGGGGGGAIDGDAAGGAGTGGSGRRSWGTSMLAAAGAAIGFGRRSAGEGTSTGDRSGRNLVPPRTSSGSQPTGGGASSTGRVCVTVADDSSSAVVASVHSGNGLPSSSSPPLRPPPPPPRPSYFHAAVPALPPTPPTPPSPTPPRPPAPVATTTTDCVPAAAQRRRRGGGGSGWRFSGVSPALRRRAAHAKEEQAARASGAPTIAVIVSVIVVMLVIGVALTVAVAGSLRRAAVEEARRDGQIAHAAVAARVGAAFASMHAAAAAVAAAMSAVTPAVPPSLFAAAAGAAAGAYNSATAVAAAVAVFPLVSDDGRGAWEAWSGVTGSGVPAGPLHTLHSWPAHARPWYAPILLSTASPASRCGDYSWLDLAALPQVSEVIDGAVEARAPRMTVLPYSATNASLNLPCWQDGGNTAAVVAVPVTLAATNCSANDSTVLLPPASASCAVLPLGSPARTNGTDAVVAVVTVVVDADAAIGAAVTRLALAAGVGVHVADVSGCAAAEVDSVLARGAGAPLPPCATTVGAAEISGGSGGTVRRASPDATLARAAAVAAAADATVAAPAFAARSAVAGSGAATTTLLVTTVVAPPLTAAIVAGAELAWNAGMATTFLVTTTVAVYLAYQRRRLNLMSEGWCTALAASQAAYDGHVRTLAWIGHNLRNPAHVISSSAAFLADALPPGSAQAEDVQNIAQSCEDIHRTLADLMNFRALQEGRLEVKLSAFNIRPLVARMAANHRSMARVPVHWHVDADVPAAVVTDPLRLQQVTVNGLTNAAKHTTTGAIVVLVSVVPASALTARRAAVADTSDVPALSTHDAAAPPRRTLRDLAAAVRARSISTEGRAAARARDAALAAANAGAGRAAAPAPPAIITAADVAAAAAGRLSPSQALDALCGRHPQLLRMAGDVVVVRVLDTGPGLSKPADRLFDAFVTGTPTTPAPSASATSARNRAAASAHSAASTTTAHSDGPAPPSPPSDTLASSAHAARLRGTGLGLPVARSMAEALGGSLTLYRLAADATLPAVTVFELLLPVVPPVLAPLLARAYPHHLPSAAGGARVPSLALPLASPPSAMRVTGRSHGSGTLPRPSLTGSAATLASGMDMLPGVAVGDGVGDGSMEGDSTGGVAQVVLELAPFGSGGGGGSGGGPYTRLPSLAVLGGDGGGVNVARGSVGSVHAPAGAAGTTRRATLGEAIEGLGADVSVGDADTVYVAELLVGSASGSAGDMGDAAGCTASTATPTPASSVAPSPPSSAPLATGGSSPPLRSVSLQNPSATASWRSPAAASLRSSSSNVLPPPSPRTMAGVGGRGGLPSSAALGAIDEHTTANPVASSVTPRTGAAAVFGFDADHVAAAGVMAGGGSIGAGAGLGAGAGAGVPGVGTGPTVPPPPPPRLSVLPAPSSTAAPAAVVAAAAAAAAPPSEFATLAVAYVDDDNVNCQIAARMLRRLGIGRIVLLGDGDEVLPAMATEALAGRELPFHVLFLDVHMSRMDGPTTAAAVRERYGSAVCLVAATGDASAKEDLLAAGFDAVMEKPFTVADLLGHLRAIALPPPASTSAVPSTPPPPPAPA